MIASRSKGIGKLGIASQWIVVAMAYWLWLISTHGYLRFWELPIAKYGLYCGVLVLGITLSYATASNSAWFVERSFSSCHRFAFRQTAFAAGLLLLLLAAEQDKTISRLFLFTFVPILYLVLVGTQRLFPPLFQKWNFGRLRMQRVLLAGSCQNVSRLRGWLHGKERLGYSIMGLVCHDRSVGTVEGIKIIGIPEDLERIIVERDVTHVVVAEFPMFQHFLAHYTDVCERHGVRLMVSCDFERSLRRPVTMFEDEGMRFISLREEPLEDPFGRFAKRCLDIAVSLPVVLFILPFTTFVVALLQWKQAPGPIFYRQIRSGLQNVPFAIFKYRTMYVANPDPARQATEGDTRIYPGGRWLRKLSMDELPQFINVLCGEMSVVGPRPHLLQHDEFFAHALANYPVRRNVKPGITGLAQVRGFRGETKTTADVVKRVESDIQYLENWSFLLDCWIIVRTALQVIFPPATAH